MNMDMNYHTYRKPAPFHIKTQIEKRHILQYFNAFYYIEYQTKFKYQRGKRIGRQSDSR